MFLIFTIFSCQDDTLKSTVDIQSELTRFIQTSKLNGKLNEIELNKFMAKHGLKLISDKNSFIYKKMEQEVAEMNQNESARSSYVECEVTAYGPFLASNGCYVFVHEMGSGCYHSNCLRNSWWCGDTNTVNFIC